MKKVILLFVILIPLISFGQLQTKGIIPSVRFNIGRGYRHTV